MPVAPAGRARRKVPRAAPIRTAAAPACFSKAIEQRPRTAGKVSRKELPEVEEEGAATNVIDFVSLLERSLQENRLTPARDSAAGTPAESAPRKRASATCKTAAKRGGDRRKRA